MTIETAIPSSTESLAALFDKLVEAVTQQVINQLGARLTDSLELAANRVVDNWADNHLGGHLTVWAEIHFNSWLEAWADVNFDSRVADWNDTYLDDRISNWAENNMDLENDIERAIRDLDLSDMVRSEIRDNITFEVIVS